MSSSTAELTMVMKARNLAQREVDRLRGGLDRAGGAAAGMGSRLAGVGKAMLTLAGGGILAVIAGLGLAVHAAAEEQVGVERMNAALAANDRSWTGNSDKIEAAIAKREELGFADDDLRDSITKLIARTHDSGEALRLQAVAMDVAALKGKTVTEATDIVTKAMAGNKKVLADLGIQLPKNATAQERLAAVQKAAAGQAERYGKTAAGAQKAFQIAMGDVIEDVGSAFLPAMTSFFTIIRRNVIPAVRDVIGRISRWVSENRPLINQIGKVVVGVLTTLWHTIRTVITWIGGVVDTISRNRDAMNILRTVAAGIATAFDLAWKAIQKAVGWIARVVRAITSNRMVMVGVRTLWDTIAGAVNSVVNALRDVIAFARRAISWLGRLNIISARTTIGGSNVPFPRYQSGGWAGLHGPELAWLGEGGPEFVVPNHALNGPGAGAGGAVINLVVDGKVLARIVDENLFYMGRRAAPTRAKV